MAKSPRKKFQAKYERAPQFQKLFYLDILKSQQTDVNGEITDTKLVCTGGTIRVHAFILQAASPLIQNAIASQGENYPFVREILLPDFQVKEVEKMLNLIYKGYVDLRNEKEVQSLQETLKFFQISSVDFGNEKTEKINGSIKVQAVQANLISKAEVKDEVKPKATVIKNPAKTEKPGTPSDQGLRRSGRAPKPLVKLGQDDGGDDDPDYKADSGDDSVEEVIGDDGKTKKRRGAPLKAAQVKIARVNEGSPARKAGPSSITTPGFSSSGIVVTTTPATTSLIANKDKQEDSGTDSEDEGWEAPDFKDKAWFNRESRRCQSCEKVYDRAAEASLCVTSHKSLRCYFCFKVYSTTDILFKHFRRRHKQAGRESTLICPFCDQAIPYKSVSCHVISVHLRTKAEDTNKGGTGNKSASGSASTTPKSNEVRKGPGRPPATTPTSSTKAHASRRRSRSVSTERVASTSRERNPPKKQKTASATTDKNKKKKGPAVKLPKATKIKMKKTTTLGSVQDIRKLQVPDLNVTLEKKTMFGRTITFKLGKQRLMSSVAK